MKTTAEYDEDNKRTLSWYDYETCKGQHAGYLNEDVKVGASKEWLDGYECGKKAREAGIAGGVM